ncbi:MAG: succinate dehydrogenase, cytochrome b556 subunit [Candidatus Brocadia sp.]|uniref:Succinate dehydrogenase cytochrome b556 subunit n=1 Tax=Candidatus Brocadia fulgida TaxID=380242 RepID=A0A0M2USJ8_9BACT|nr:MAG: succinate dehydrogenase subunit C [Candidatus Brocadia fulgida]MCC6325235.1 succinate dehydrogenase, cytochrome b556 subunit [Candidatus Brocadia sp.]MCE7911038.1 succinate dehydrogenase, cytochrome b556 subunit [Candidatus Brocadia sp. AMX3]MBV6518094.1 Succinate dehydrogenase 2 membrane subunit SdhC [Candidatus Brocadia fulgida]MDG5996343.1 succinate dehydrogenase, cytochrome b556 subunit [Candidatus Brocadia sp.]
MNIQKIKEGYKDFVKNRNMGMYAFWLHRITGIVITVFLFLHIWTLSAVFRGKDAYDYAISKFDTKFGYLFQYVLLLIVAIHLINGLRITVVDFCGVTRSQKKLLWISLFVLILIAAVGVMTVLL